MIGRLQIWLGRFGRWCQQSDCRSKLKWKSHMFAPVFFIYLDVAPRKQNTHHSIMFNSKMQMSAMLTASPTLLLGTNLSRMVFTAWSAKTTIKNMMSGLYIEIQRAYSKKTETVTLSEKLKSATTTTVTISCSRNSPYTKVSLTSLFSSTQWSFTPEFLMSSCSILSTWLSYKSFAGLASGHLIRRSMLFLLELFWILQWAWRTNGPNVAMFCIFMVDWFQWWCWWIIILWSLPFHENLWTSCIYMYIIIYIYITVYLGLLFNDYWYFYGRVAVYLLPFERPSGPSSPQQWQSPCRPCPCRPPRRRWSGCGGSGGDGLQLWYGRNIVWCMYMTCIYIYDVYDIYDIYYGIWMDMEMEIDMEMETWMKILIWRWIYRDWMRLIWMDMVIHLIMEIRTMGIWIPVNGLMRVPQCG